MVPKGSFEDIEALRIRFEDMSRAAIDMQRHFGNHADQAASIAYCPMAFDFSGAEWLQRGTEVNNPYFGASMLRCGDIQETFEPLPGIEEHGEHGHE